MGSRARNKQVRAATTQQQVPLTPVVEGPDPDAQCDAFSKKETSSSWELIREWFRIHKGKAPLLLPPPNSSKATHDIRLLLGVLGCPLAPIPLPINHHHLRLTNKQQENSVAHYIIQQYLAATGILSKRHTNYNPHKNMYATGDLKMIRCETEVSSGKTVKSLGGRSSTDTGCFVIWQMSPGMWSLELVVSGIKVLAGSDGKKTVWRHTPWMGTHAAKGPLRPLRRIIQGLDPRSTASLFAKAQCLGEKRIGESDCFVLKVAAEREAVMERSEEGASAAEVLRHVLYGYFCQKSGLLVYLEDSHLTRVLAPDDAVYWETTIGSSVSDYRDVDGVLLAHQGRSVATVFRFEEESHQHSRTRMEEHWRIDDVVFNVQGLSSDHFIPPADICL